MNIYIANLSHETTEEDLHQAFETFGRVASVKIIKDRYSGEWGFGLVEMPVRAEATFAIKGLNGTVLKGEMIKVSEARPGSERHGGGAG
jgi:RNA recognition motif-containing protein